MHPYPLLNPPEQFDDCPQQIHIQRLHHKTDPDIDDYIPCVEFDTCAIIQQNEVALLEVHLLKQRP